MGSFISWIDRSQQLLINHRALTILIVLVLVQGCGKPATFHKPVRLEAAGTSIDTGDAGGHSGPCIADVDCDGLLDLVVGDFSGQFRVYRNVGTEAEPRYGPHTLLRASAIVARIPAG